MTGERKRNLHKNADFRRLQKRKEKKRRTSWLEAKKKGYEEGRERERMLRRCSEMC
jgi:hypothetical protein